MVDRSCPAISDYRGCMASRTRESEFSSLPGGAFVAAGIEELKRGECTVNALLVSIGAPRLERLGLEIPASIPSPEHRLYEVLRAEEPDDAHSRYNALIRRLVSFERAAECAS